LLSTRRRRTAQVERTRRREASQQVSTGSAARPCKLARIAFIVALLARRASGMAATLKTAAPPVAATRTQTISFVRHGQAQHNVRAEAKRDAGCPFEEFIDAMKLDDAFDADLTDVGREQARSAHAPEVQLVVASPLSRAVETASLMYPGREVVCVEELREWCGQLVNSKRRTASQLKERFPFVDVSHLPENDERWDAEVLEEEASVARRGMAALAWLARRPEDNIAVVAHGGLLAVTFDPEQHGGHSCVEAPNACTPRFSNCECRTVQLFTGDGAFRVRSG
jgi:broad specificity phosphatase PhoE